MNTYIEITQEQYNEWQNTQNGVNVFHAVQDLQGRYVVDSNVLKEFPEYFSGLQVTILALTLNDFPTPENFDI